MEMNEPDGATPLDPDELSGLKFRHLTTRTELDHLEQANIQDGLAWLGRIRKPDILTVTFICKLHRQIFGKVWDWAGSFRTTGKNIGVDAAQIGPELRQLLDDMKYWLAHKTYCDQEAAMRFHHRLVYIHVFANGNGRHARIMADAVLQKLCDKPPFDWAKGHDLQSMNSRRTQYIAALKAADNHDYGPLLTFVGVTV